MMLDDWGEDRSWYTPPEPQPPQPAEEPPAQPPVNTAPEQPQVPIIPTPTVPDWTDWGRGPTADAPPAWEEPTGPPAGSQPGWTPYQGPQGVMPEWPSWMPREPAPLPQLPPVPTWTPTLPAPIDPRLPTPSLKQGPSYQDLDYWVSKGIPSANIFDPATGQLKPGWYRTANGYDTINGPGAAKIRAAYKTAIGREATDKEVIDWLSGKNGHGQGEDGIEKIVAAIYGQSTTYKPPAPTTPTAPTPKPPGSVPPNGWQNWFMTLTRGRKISPEELAAMAPFLAEYGVRVGPKNARGWSDTIILPDGTVVDVIEAADTGTGKSWAWMVQGPGGSTGTVRPNVSTPGVPGLPTPGPQFSDAYTKYLEQLMQFRINELNQSVNDPLRQQYADAMQRRAQALAAAEPQYKQLLDYLQKRFMELQGPGYTGAEHEVLRTQALDPIERDRTAAKQRVMQRLSQRGIDPKSGIFEAAIQEVDRAFDSMRGQNQTALATNELARREDRSQRALGIGAQLVDIPQAREREQLDVFSALEQLSAGVRGEEDARRRESISYAGALADLPVQRMQLAMQAAGMGGSPDSMFGNLLQLAGMNQNAAQLGNRQSAGFWSGLGSIAAVLANSGRR